MTDEAATKKDVEGIERRLDQKIDNLGRDLREFIRDREVQSIRWFVGTQITYFVITLGAMYFMLGKHP